jgi:hypothetical protein
MIANCAQAQENNLDVAVHLLIYSSYGAAVTVGDR